jgi:hypothetical protein
MTTDRHLSLCILAGLALAATPAQAVASLTLLAGERVADFHTYTGGKGYDTGTGTDFTVDLAANPLKDFPLSAGLFYSSQSYSLTGARDLFDSGTVTELGPEVTVTVAGANLRGFFRYAQSLSGKFVGKIANGRTMETGAGQTSYTAGSEWDASLTGPHVGAGMMFGNEFVGVGLILDLAFLHSKITKLEVNGSDVTEAYAPYMKTDSDLQSTALMLALEARL